MDEFVLILPYSDLLWVYAGSGIFLQVPIIPAVVYPYVLFEHEHLFPVPYLLVPAYLITPGTN